MHQRTTRYRMGLRSPWRGTRPVPHRQSAVRQLAGQPGEKFSISLGYLLRGT